MSLRPTTSDQRGAGYGTAQAATWQYAYDPATLGETAVVDPNGHLSTATFHGDGNKLSATDALGRTTTSTYNSLDEVTSLTPPKLYGSATATTTYSYDESGYSSGGHGNLTTVSTPIVDETGTSLGTETTHYVHGSAAFPGDVTSMIDPGANTWGYSYDSFGDQVTVTAPATSDNSEGTGSRQNVTKSAYQTSTGWLTATLSPRYVLAHPSDTTCSPPAVGCTTVTHDPMGHVLVTTDGTGAVTTASYDLDENLAYSIDANSDKTSYTYDPGRAADRHHRTGRHDHADRLLARRQRRGSGRRQRGRHPLRLRSPRPCDVGHRP